MASLPSSHFHLISYQNQCGWGDRAMEDEQRNCISQMGEKCSDHFLLLLQGGYMWSACRNLENQGKLWTIFANSDILHPQVLLRTLKKKTKNQNEPTESSPQASLLLQSTIRHLLCFSCFLSPPLWADDSLKGNHGMNTAEASSSKHFVKLFHLGLRWGIAPNCPEPAVAVGTSHWFLLQLTPPRETP